MIAVVPPAAYLSHLFLAVADTTPWCSFMPPDWTSLTPLAGKSLTLAAAHPLIYSLSFNHSLWFQVPMVNCNLKILNGTFQKKQFKHCKLFVILSNRMKSHAIALYPAQDMKHLFIQGIHTVDATLPAYEALISHLSYQISCCGITVLMFR